jgi:hypothetical protein
VRNQPDEIDLAAIEWAKQRRIILGIAVSSSNELRIEPHERLGKLRSTLGSIKDNRVSAGERTTRMGLNGHPDQDWPEVYLHIALDVHRAFQLMSGEQRMVMDLHYVWREIPTALRVRESRLDEARYFRAVSGVKAFLRGYLAAVSRAKPASRPSKELEAAYS